ncbi:hypothetical protein E3P96_02447 [Wallemia ichthyophaga]|nr:hypothetical protein E3P96_02447 [Wallemia ichthyophaga]
MAPHVQPSEFLRDLAELFERVSGSVSSGSGSGTVFLTQKRYQYHDKEGAEMDIDADSPNPAQFHVLLRATAQIDDKKYKSATRIPSDQLDGFVAHYNSLLHAHLHSNLRKRDRKREKRKADIAAVRKRRLETPVDIPHSKRGSGRRKFQRKVKAEQRRLAALHTVASGTSGQNTLKIP